MEIKFNVKHSPKPPCSVSCYTHGDMRGMKWNIEKSGKVNVTVSSRTKTSINIEVWFDEDSFAVAHVPSGAERFKFVEAANHSVFSNNDELRYYFRIGKKQGLAELKEYLSLVLCELDFSLDTLVVDMNIIGIDELKEA